MYTFTFMVPNKNIGKVIGSVISYKKFIAHVRLDYMFQCGVVGRRNNSLSDIMHKPHPRAHIKTRNPV